MLLRLLDGFTREARAGVPVSEKNELKGGLVLDYASFLD